MVTQRDVDEFGDLWSLMYVIFAKEMVDSFGEDGMKALVRAVRNYGKARGERLRKRHEEMGLPINMKNLFEVYDLPSTSGTRKERKVFTDDELVSYTYACPYEKIWRANDGVDLGLVYCENFHHAFWQTYRPDIDVKIPEILTKNDPHCLFKVRQPSNNKK